MRFLNMACGGIEWVANNWVKLAVLSAMLNVGAVLSAQRAAAQAVPVAGPGSALAANAVVSPAEIPAGSTATQVAQGWTWRLYFDAAAPVIAVPACAGVACTFAAPFGSLAAAAADSVQATVANVIGEGPKSAALQFLLLKSAPGAPTLTLVVTP